jgi:hypothetical protein
MQITSRFRFPRALVALALALPVVGASEAGAQERSSAALRSRFSAGAAAQGSEPRGDFGKNTNTGWGFSAHGLVRLDDASIVNWRGDFSFLTYGNSRRRIPLAGTGGLIQLDLRTSNNIVSVVTGPQLLGPTGVFTPYAAALGGFSVFWTESTVEGSQNNNTPFASTTNNSDAVLAYGGQAGLLVRVYNGRTPVRLDVGARLLRHDKVQYLTDERVREAFEQDRPPVPVRGRADFVTYYIGFNAIVY